ILSRIRSTPIGRWIVATSLLALDHCECWNPKRPRRLIVIGCSVRLAANRLRRSRNSEGRGQLEEECDENVHVGRTDGCVGGRPGRWRLCASSNLQSAGHREETRGRGAQQLQEEM